MVDSSVAAEREAVPTGGAEVYPLGSPGPADATAQPTLALVDSAERSRRTGDAEGAAALLERALRIEPKNPRLWNRLAHLRLEQGQLNEAQQLAARSNALARTLPELRRDNWGIIAAARERLGDPDGANDARRRRDEIR